MTNLSLEFENVLNEIGEITANYKPYKILDEGPFYKTYHSCSLKNDEIDLSIGYNVYREKTTNHMKMIEIHERTPENNYVLLIEFLTPKIERFEIFDNGTRMESLGGISLEQAIEYLQATNNIFRRCLPK